MATEYPLRLGCSDAIPRTCVVSRATPTSKESGSGQIPISVSCLTRQEILGVLIECLSGFNGCDVKTHVW